MFNKPKYIYEQYATNPHLAARIIASIGSEAIENKFILDLGCGTGILGLSCLLVGAGHVCFFEYDTDIIDVIHKNCQIVGIDSSRYSIINSAVSNPIFKSFYSLYGNSSIFRHPKQNKSSIPLKSTETLSESTLPIPNQTLYAIDSKIQYKAVSLKEPNFYKPVNILFKPKKPPGGTPPSPIFDFVITNPPFGIQSYSGSDFVFLEQSFLISKSFVICLCKSASRKTLVKKGLKFKVDGRRIVQSCTVVSEMLFDIPASLSIHKKKNHAVEVDLLKFSIVSTN